MKAILLPHNHLKFPLVKLIVSKIAYKSLQNTKTVHFLRMVHRNAVLFFLQSPKNAEKWEMKLKSHPKKSPWKSKPNKSPWKSHPKVTLKSHPKITLKSHLEKSQPKKSPWKSHPKVTLKKSPKSPLKKYLEKVTLNSRMTFQFHFSFLGIFG